MLVLENALAGGGLATLAFFSAMHGYAY